MKNDDQQNYNGRINENFQTTYLKNKQFINELDKKLVFQTDKAKESLLDENNLRD
jgi:hypothetical protein